MKKKAALNKILNILLCVLLVVSLLSLLLVWNKHIAHRYDGKVFYISSEGTPEIKDTIFVDNGDGTHTAKLYGVFPMGRCWIYQVSRPTVTINNLGLYIQSTAPDSVKIMDFSFENSPAEMAGLQVGDYIYSCNDFVVSNNCWDLTGSVSYIRPNKITVIRDGERLTFDVPTNEDNLMGIHYGPSNSLLGTMCFRDGDYFWGIGHNTTLDVVNAQGAFVSFGISDIGITPVLSTRERDFAIKAATDKGVLGYINNTYDFLEGREVELAWEWEVDYSKPATIELALTDGSEFIKDAPVKAEKKEIGVTISKFEGRVKDIEGNYKASYAYKVKSDNFEFLKGMSGSPVFQNNRLVGFLAAVDVNDTTTAYVISSEEAYSQYLLEREGLT